MRKYFQLNNFTVCLVVTILVLISTFVLPRQMGRLELLAQDFFFSTRGHLTPGNEVAIATIDEKSIDKLGRWPWDRNVIADLVDALKEYKVKVYGFDVVFSSPERAASPETLQALEKQLLKSGLKKDAIDRIIGDVEANSDNDQKLYEALRRNKKAVLGYFFHFSEAGLEHLTDTEMDGYLNIVAKSRYSGIKKDAGTELKGIRLKTAYAVEATIEKISKATKRMGYFNFAPDLDGSVRKIPLIVKYRNMVDIEGEDDYLFPPLSMTVLRKYLKSSIIIWMDAFGVNQVAHMGRTNYVIPTNSIGEMRINYYGPGGTFPHYPIVDIIERKIDPEKLNGKIILIGPTATAIEDLRITPFDKVFPGVESHATVIDNILHERYLKDPTVPKELVDILSVLLIGVILVLAVPRLSALAGGGLAVVIALVSVMIHYILFAKYNIVTESVVPPLLETLMGYASLGIYRFVVEEKEKRYIQGAFGQYLSPVVIDQLIDDPSALQLGGQRKELTAFFSDVAGFSTISEKLSPEELVLLLNEYLTEMTDIIMKYDGVVDKFEGDAIIAFFGAPLDFEDHARRCVLTAVEMQDKLEEMRQGWAKEGKSLLRMRIGMNTGKMVVGNMGSKTRMDYTMMGDAVNLAARLEGANKAYGTETMISHYTYDACGELFETRELDKLRVVGKKEAITVYEVLSLKGKLSTEKQEVVNLYKQGMEHYTAWEWRPAIEKFSQILDIDVHDGPAMTYLERCLDFKLKPPEKDWDGVFIMTSK